MNRIILLFSFIFAIGFLTGCGPNVETSTEMGEFLKLFGEDGSRPVLMDEAGMEFGYESDNVPEMGYGLTNPEVQSKATEGDNECYTVNFDKGKEETSLVICWKDKKIVDIKAASVAE